MAEIGSLHGLTLEADGDDPLQVATGNDPERAGQSERGASPTQPVEKTDKNKRRRAQARKDAQAKETENPQGQGSVLETQKCTGFCGRKKPLTEYNQDQRKCKECVLHERSFWRFADKQKSKTDMRALEASDPALFKDIQKEFIKERQKAANAEQKVKFNIASFKKSLQSRSGDRRDDQRVMMWEGLWKEESKTAKYGYLTTEEAEKKWKDWLADDSIPKDYNGPRGYQQVAVPSQSVLSNFKEVAQQKELTESERLSRTATQETIQNRVNMVTSASALAAGETIRGISIQEQNAKASSSGLDMEQMGAPDLEDVAALVQKRRRLSGRSGKSQEDAGDGDEDAEAEQTQSEDDEEQNKKKGKEKDKKDKWFDAETKCRKAERSWVASVDALEKTAKELMDDCQKTMTEFRALTDRSSYTEEMSILDRRLQWLRAVVDGESALEDMLKGQDTEEKKSMEESQTTSQDLSALSRVGPCKDFKELKAIDTLRNYGADFRTCNSNEAIKETNEQLAKTKKIVNTLLAAVKAAKGDLVGARKREEATQKREADKAAKAEKAAAKAAAAAAAKGSGSANKGGDPSQSGVSRKKISTQSFLLDQNSILWQEDEFKILSLLKLEQSQWPDVITGDQPFIVSGVCVPQDVSNALKEFGKVFGNSSLRVTEGRAQTTLPAGVEDVLQLIEEDVLPVAWRARLADPPAPPLQAAMKITAFGVAACSVSTARTEVGMQACLRIICHGSMMVAVHTLPRFQEAQDLLTSQELMGTGNSDALLAAARSGALRVATVGPGDCLFLPAASVLAQRAHNDDILGVRCGVLARVFQPRLTELFANNPRINRYHDPGSSGRDQERLVYPADSATFAAQQPTQCTGLANYTSELDC